MQSKLEKALSELVGNPNNQFVKPDRELTQFDKIQMEAKSRMNKLDEKAIHLNSLMRETIRQAKQLIAANEVLANSGYFKVSQAHLEKLNIESGFTGLDEIFFALIDAGAEFSVTPIVKMSLGDFVYRVSCNGMVNFMMSDVDSSD